MLIIGSHVSYSNGILTSVKEALNYNANTFMFYTGAPTNTIRSAIDPLNTKEALKLMKTNNIDINNVICHAPYIINLASKANIEKYLFSINFLKNELYRCEELGVSKIVVHPGNAVGITKEEGLANISEALNLIIDESTNVTILLETMAGKGSECGTTVEELRTIIDNVNKKNRVGICIDTCHINDAGYNISNFNDYLELVDKLIGINKIGCIHVNDSKNDFNSHKDRHANIGFGTIGFNNLLNVIYNDKLKSVPKILETPYIDKLYAPYKYEITMIRNKEFNPNLINDVINNSDI